MMYYTFTELFPLYQRLVENKEDSALVTAIMNTFENVDALQELKDIADIRFCLSAKRCLDDTISVETLLQERKSWDFIRDQIHIYTKQKLNKAYGTMSQCINEDYAESNKED